MLRALGISTVLYLGVAIAAIMIRHLDGRALLIGSGFVGLGALAWWRLRGMAD